ncbi:uncharacterized protein C8orf34-like [Watersipora subatra]|uniref:uncharacterized protein C8orf34-like n=1 Tax=Watersipora subatra TaxID=2589382 RepID=UPI00355B3ED8
MSNAAKVQAYLSKHKIASLFEGLMAKLVKDMPAEPLGYLSTRLQEKKEKTRRGSPPGGVDSSTDYTTSVWTADSYNYEKPWRAHSKKLTQKSSETKKNWDKTVRINAKSFDDLVSTTKPSKSQAHELFGSRNTGNADCYVTEEELLAGELLSRSTRSEEDNSDIKDSDVSKHHPKHKGPKADAAKHSQELKAFVEAKRAEGTKADSGIGSAASDDDESIGVRVLAEDSTDLAAEGIKVPSSTTSAIKVHKPAISGDPMIHLSICSRCAKVLVKNGDDAESVSGSSTSASTLRSTRNSKQKKPQSTARTDQWATHRADSKASPQQNPAITGTRAKTDGATGSRMDAGRTAMGQHESSGVMDRGAARPAAGRSQYVATQRTGYSSFYDDEDDDEFESVSQISGDKLRVPMWTNSDDDDLSPVKGSHMLSSPRLSKPSSAGNQRRAVTLKEDTLKTLPLAGNQVENFVGASRTWSGERADAMKDVSRRSHDSSISRKPRDMLAVGKSYDSLTANRSAGWKFETDSDDESAVM